MPSILYTSPGTYTWVSPPGIQTVYAIVIGGGGGGSGRTNPSYSYSSTINQTAFSFNSFSGGGGAGGLGIGMYNIYPLTGYTITVGTGGKKAGRSGPVGGTNINAYGNGTTTGSSGGSSSFGSFLTCTGGTGGPLLTNTDYYDGTPGGSSYGHNVYGATGGKGGGFRYTPSLTSVPTDGFATGGGGLCGADGGHIYKTYNGITLNISQYQITNGGGMYPKGSAWCSSYTGNMCEGNWGSGINNSVDWKVQAMPSTYDLSPTLFSSVTSNSHCFDANGIDSTTVDTDNTTNNYFGGQQNRVYKPSSGYTPPHLDLLYKLFRMMCGPNRGVGTGINGMGYTITGGSGCWYYASSTILTGGTAGIGCHNAASTANVWPDIYKTGFGCGGGGAHTYVYDTSARPEQNGIDGGNGLVYLEWN